MTERVIGKRHVGCVYMFLYFVGSIRTEPMIRYCTLYVRTLSDTQPPDNTPASGRAQNSTSNYCPNEVASPAVSPILNWYV